MLRAVSPRVVRGGAPLSQAHRLLATDADHPHPYDLEHPLLTEQQQYEVLEKIKEAELEGHPLPCRPPEMGLFREETLADLLVRETLEIRQKEELEQCNPAKPVLCREEHIHDVCCGGDEVEDQSQPHSESG